MSNTDKLSHLITQRNMLKIVLSDKEFMKHARENHQSRKILIAKKDLEKIEAQIKEIIDSQKTDINI